MVSKLSTGGLNLFRRSTFTIHIQCIFVEISHGHMSLGVNFQSYLSRLPLLFGDMCEGVSDNDKTCGYGLVDFI